MLLYICEPPFVSCSLLCGILRFYKWYHTVFVYLCLSYLTQYSTFHVAANINIPLFWWGSLFVCLFSKWHGHPTDDTAPQLSFHLCTHTEKHQVLFLFSHGKCVFEAHSGTSSSTYFLANWTIWSHLQLHRSHLPPFSHTYPFPALSDPHYQRSQRQT